MATEAQRKKFRERIKKALAEAGMTQKALEIQVGLKSGSMTRIYGGRKQPDAELIVALGAALNIAPEKLASGTPWKALLEDAPVVEAVPEAEPDPEPEAAPEPEPEAAPEPEPEAPPESEPEPEVEPEPEAEPEPETEPESAAEPEPEIVAEEPETLNAEPQPEPTESGPRRKKGFLDYPIRAAVAVAGGAALVGAAVFTLLRRR